MRFAVMTVAMSIVAIYAYIAGDDIICMWATGILILLALSEEFQ